MDRSLPRAGNELDLLPAAAGEARASRHVARERQKQDLRRERDRLMVDLARELGPLGLAEHLGVAPPAMTRLLVGARERLNAARAEGGSRRVEISARRLRPGEGRWAEADAHYEALGRAPRSR